MEVHEGRGGEGTVGGVVLVLLSGHHTVGIAGLTLLDHDVHGAGVRVVGEGHAVLLRVLGLVKAGGIELVHMGGSLGRDEKGLIVSHAGVGLAGARAC